MPGPAVELSDVSKTYHEGDSERIVLRDVSVAIAPGEIELTRTLDSPSSIATRF